jgi:steroid 5-alpha reductase family enzyme
LSFAGRYQALPGFSIHHKLSPAPEIAIDHQLTTPQIRLTYNYYRKGGYKWGAEDYRWIIVKSRMPSWAFVIFDLTFISLYQSLLLLAVTFPCYLLLLVSQIPGHAAMTTSDTVISRILAVLLILETLADQQQWNYQQAKASYKATGKVPEGFTKEDLDRGFVVSGLWSIVRHPNFTCEQAFWLGVYQWGCWQTETMWNWAGVGALGYCAVFQGSTRLTEDITGKKYPEYKEYQRLVNCFVPGFRSFSAPQMVEGGKGKKEL